MSGQWTGMVCCWLTRSWAVGLTFGCVRVRRTKPSVISRNELDKKCFRPSWVGGGLGVRASMAVYVYQKGMYGEEKGV